MINQENLDKLYEKLINGEPLPLTTKALKNECNFCSKDLSDLIEGHVLTRVGRGYYSPGVEAVNELLKRAKKFVATKHFGEAIRYFERCSELDPSNEYFTFKLFIMYARMRNGTKAFDCLKDIYDMSNKNHNYYLYLLSMIIELPEQYKELAKEFSFDDIRVSFIDGDIDEANRENRIRKIAFFKQNFRRAVMEKLNIIRQNEGKCTQEDLLIISLLKQANTVRTNTKQKVIDLVNLKKYDELVEYLESIQNQHNLSPMEECELSLAKDLCYIRENGSIPQVQVFLSQDVRKNSLFSAIHRKDYQLALELNTSMFAQSETFPKGNAINKLLRDIVAMIRENDDYYGCPLGTDDFPKIVALISSGMSIDEACEQVELDENAKGIMYLLYARECYSIENYELGDQYLEKFEAMQNLKSENETSLLNEIRENKESYKDREAAVQKRLLLIPQAQA